MLSGEGSGVTNFVLKDGGGNGDLFGSAVTSLRSLS